MIPNVTRGDRMAGLVTYLAGPGRANEHVEPHLVAGDAALMVWHGDDVLDRAAAAAVARHLDLPRTALGVQVTGGHVWHCSLSLRVDEGELGDQTWGQVAQQFVAAMGFDDQQGTRAPCRWVAVHHGASSRGNDHIHVAVNLVREDGTKADVGNDYRRAQAAARALEVEHDLAPLRANAYDLARTHARAAWEAGRRERGGVPWVELTDELQQAQVAARFDTDAAWEAVRTARDERAPGDTAGRGVKPGEREAAARRTARATHEGAHGAGSWERLDPQQRQAAVTAQAGVDAPREVLALRVRAAATAAGDEGEFVRRCRRSGVLIRPRYAAGAQGVVVGYSVATRPEQEGASPVWFGGGRLGRDLTLPRLREQHAWTSATPADAEAVVGEWQAAARGRPMVSTGPDVDVVDPEQVRRCAQELGELTDRLAGVDPGDRQTWAAAARHGAGVFAQWSARSETGGIGPLGDAARELARSAQTYERPVRAAQGPLAGQAVGALFTLAAAAGGRSGDVAVFLQLMRLARAVTDAQRAVGEARRAQGLARTYRQSLMKVRADLQTQAALAGKITAAQPPPPPPAAEAPGQVAGERTAQESREEQLDPAAREALRLARLSRPGGSPVPNRIDPAPAAAPAGPVRTRGTPRQDTGPER